jgi:hypothetical protein
MAQLVREAMARLSAERETHLFTAGVSDDIFVKKLGKPNFEYVPRHVYFYYIRINTDGTLKVDHYEYFEPDPNFPTDPVKKWKEIPRTQAELEALTRRLVDNARPTGAQQGKTGSKFQGVIWDRRSYIIFFFDEKNWRLYRKPTDGSCVVFLTEKGTTKYVKNHTFYDAIDLEIDFGAGDTRSAVAFINHVKEDEHGNELGHGLPPGQKKKQDFQFNLFLNVEFEGEGGGASPMDVIIDPGGTNQGPPLEP